MMRRVLNVGLLSITENPLRAMGLCHKPLLEDINPGFIRPFLAVSGLKEPAAAAHIFFTSEGIRPVVVTPNATVVAEPPCRLAICFG
jgi:hypothetical protein